MKKPINFRPKLFSSSAIFLVFTTDRAVRVTVYLHNINDSDLSKPIWIGRMVAGLDDGLDFWAEILFRKD